MEQLSLVIFTVLAQAAAGTAVALAALFFVLDGGKKRELLLAGFAVLLVILAVAGMASLTHLGHPFRAMNVMMGLFHGSPLSIEIVMVSLFGGASGAAWLMMWKKHPLGEHGALFVLCAVLGLGMVYAISRVYNIQTVDAWYTIWTPLQFFTTTLVLGIGITSLLLLFFGYAHFGIRFGAVVALVAAFISIPAFTQFLGTLADPYGVITGSNTMAWRYGFLLLGSALWLGAMMSRNARPLFTATAGVGLVLLSELAGRAYFYDLLSQRLL